MIKENLLSVSDIARELSTGKATIKFLLKRFKKHIPSQRIDGTPLYPANAIKTLFAIQEKLEMGVLPSDIEQELNSQNGSLPDALVSSFEAPLENGDIRLSNDGLALLKSLFNDIGEQQQRIATAHEKRAQAEERKAVAIEKRASAEEKKAEAMNNIAAALQEMNQLRSTDPAAQQIVHQAATVIANDELDESGKVGDLGQLDNFDEITEPEESFETPEMKNLDDADLDLSSLLEEDDILTQPDQEDLLSETSDLDFDEALEDSLSDPLADIDEELEIDDVLEMNNDLSSLIDDDPLADIGDINDLDDLSSLIDETDDSVGALPDIDIPPPDKSGDLDIADELDDLSLLIDAPQNEALETPGSDIGSLDDLSLLIDDQVDAQVNNQDEIQLDDLSALIDPDDGAQNDLEPDAKLDDLSKLIDTQNDDSGSHVSESDKPVPELDDLSQLIDPLSGGDKIIADSGVQKDEISNQLDDLSKLIDEPDTPEIKLDVAIEDGLGKYKAAVMKVIIGLKTEGLSAEETTARLNKNQIKTLSGKPNWGQRAISQIYKFIDAAK